MINILDKDELFMVQYNSSSSHYQAELHLGAEHSVRRT